MSGSVDVYVINVAGVSFRQDTIAGVKVGDKCRLMPQPDNEHDPDAVRVVLVDSNKVIGYVPRQLSAMFNEAIAAGFKFDNKVSYVGRNSENDQLWVQLEVKMEAPGQ